MPDFPPLKANERPIFIAATGADDPYYRPSEGAMEYACDLCGAAVMLDRKSQLLLPLPVYCIHCFASMREKPPLRRA